MPVVGHNFVLGSLQQAQQAQPWYESFHPLQIAGSSDEHF